MGLRSPDKRSAIRESYFRRKASLIPCAVGWDGTKWNPSYKRYRKPKTLGLRYASSQPTALRENGVYGYSDPSRVIRVKPDGSHQNVPLETDNSTILSLFGDNESTCYTLRKEQNNDPLPDEYVCKDLSGNETNRAVMPPRNPNIWWAPHNPLMNPPTRTVYITLPPSSADYWTSSYTLWHLKNPASRDNGLWLTAFESEPLKTATLTIGGGLGEHDMGYTIHVERDAIGRITEKRENLEGQTLKQSYTYDQAGRLIEVKTGEAGQETIETWGYDNNGNRTHHNGAEIATFDAQDRIIQQNGTTFEHNLIGQRIKKTAPEGITTYRYDNLGNLRDVALPDGTAITYAIDPQDRRIGRKVNGNWTHKWIYQDGLNPIAEMDSENRIRKAFVYADKGHVPAYMLTFDENGNETAQYRIVSDLLGSVRVVYDLTTGHPVQQIDYDVWGNVVSNTNPDFQPFAFAGGLYDQQTKLTRFGARDYDPETGRWTAKDPIDFGGGDANLYGYVANDPVNWIDPNGLMVRWSGAAVGGARGYSRGAALGGDRYELESECKNGQRCTATVIGVGVGLGVSYKYLPFSITAGPITLLDPSDTPSLDSLKGTYSKGGCGFAGGVNYVSYYQVQLGSAISVNNFSNIYDSAAIDMSCSFIIGITRVSGSCGCC